MSLVLLRDMMRAQAGPEAIMTATGAVYNIKTYKSFDHYFTRQTTICLEDNMDNENKDDNYEK